MARRSPPVVSEEQRYRTLVWATVAYLLALPLAVLWDVLNHFGLDLRQVLFVSVDAVAVATALVVLRTGGPRAAFATAVAGGFVVVTFGMYLDVGTAGVTWAAYVGLIAVVALSPANRWTLGAAAAAGAGVYAVTVALALGGADPAYTDPYKAGAIVCLLVVFAILARDVARAIWARGDAATSTAARLEAGVDRAVEAQRCVAAGLRALVRDVEASAADLDAAGALDRIVADADAATALVDEMLDASRVRTGLVELQLERLDPARLAAVVAGGIPAGPAVVEVDADPVYLDRAQRAAAGAAAPWTVHPNSHEVLLTATVVAAPTPVECEIAAGIVEAHGGWCAWDDDVVVIGLPAAGTATAAHGIGTQEWDPWRFVVEEGLGFSMRGGLAWIAAALAFTAASILVWGAPGSVVWMLACAAMWPVAILLARRRDVSGAYEASIVAHTLVIAGLVASTGGIAGALWILVLIPAGMTIVLARWKMIVLGAFATGAIAAAVIPTMPPVYVQAIDVPLALPIFAVLLLVPASRGFDRIAARVEAANSQLDEHRREATTFLAVIAHELRTPLTSVRAAAESLLAGGWPPDVEAEFHETIRHEAGRLDAFVDDLDASAGRRLEHIEVRAERVDVEAVVTAAVAAAVAAAGTPAGGHAVSTSVPPGLAVRADPVWLREVLDNLLSNALRYCAAGTAISVAAKPTRDGGDLVVFEVVDAGPGVRHADRDRVFERYWRAAGSPGHGTGLGLAIARALVEAHGAGCRIWSEETPGGGATFRFTLPAAVADRAAAHT